MWIESGKIEDHERKENCRLHGIIPKDPVPRRSDHWVIDNEVTLAVWPEFSFGP